MRLISGKTVKSLYNILVEHFDSAEFTTSRASLESLLKQKKSPGLKSISQIKKILTDLVANEVQGIRAFKELQRKLAKELNGKDFDREFGEGETPMQKVEHFVLRNQFESQFDKTKMRSFGKRLERLKKTKKTLREFLLVKKAKPKKKENTNDILKFYKKDPNMMVIEFNKNKKIKIEKKPSIENLEQSNLYT